MAIRLTESALRRIIREEAANLMKNKNRQLSEMPVRRGRYFTPGGDDMGDIADVEYDVMNHIMSNPEMTRMIDNMDEKNNISLVKRAATELGYPDLSPRFIRNIAASLLDADY
jgi:hypothetical protein